MSYEDDYREEHQSTAQRNRAKYSSEKDQQAKRPRRKRGEPHIALDGEEYVRGVHYEKGTHRGDEKNEFSDLVRTTVNGEATDPLFIMLYCTIFFLVIYEALKFLSGG